MTHFAPLVFSSVIATMVSRSFFGIKPWYEVPVVEFTSLMQLPWFLLVGVGAGLLGAVFLKMLRYAEDRFRALKVPIYVKLALGGLLVGLIAIEFPGVWGNGYVVTNRIIHGEYLNEDFPLLFLGGLFLAKLLATVVTIGSGAVGGVFTPTLFLGSSLGALAGTIFHRLDYALELPEAAFALVGMAGVLAATTRSPLLAMILVFEISLDYSLMPPLMLGCVVAILTAGRFHRESIYSEPLRLRGLQLNRETTQPGVAVEQTVGDLMRSPVPPVQEHASFRDIADRFVSNSNNFLPVVDADHRLVGIVALQDLKEHLNSGHELGAVIASDVMRPPPKCAVPSQSLMEALPIVLESELRNIPVVNSAAERRLVGSLSRSEVLAILSEAITAGSRPTG